MDGEVLLNNVDFKKLFFKINHQKWLAIGFAIASFSISYILTMNTPPQYVTSALIQVDSQLGSANNMQQILGSLETPFAANGQASPADIEIALIKSRFILQSVIEKLGLNIDVKPRYFPLIGKIFVRRQQQELHQPVLGLSQFAWGGESIKINEFKVDHDSYGLRFRLRKDDEKHYSLFLPDGRKLLDGTLKKRCQTASGIKPEVSIQVNHLQANVGTEFDIALKLNDDVLKQLTNSLTIIDLGDRSKTKTGVLQLSVTGSDRDFIPGILNTIVDFAIARNIEKKSAEASKTLDFLNRQLPSVRKSLHQTETELNVYRVKSGSIDISQEGRIALMQLSAVEQNIASVKLKKVEMLQELTPLHPYIIALGQKQLQLQKEVLNIENRIKTLPITDQRALSLERDVKVKDQLYLLLLNKIQQLQVLKAGTLSDVRILSPATTPIVPIPSNRNFTVFLSTLLGLFAGIGYILIRDFFRRGVQNPERIEEYLQISSFAIIPHSTQQKEISQEMKRSIHLHKPFILARMAPKDIAIEGIRSLRTILQFTLAQAENNIVSIIGARPDIGKSFVATNLAQILADSGKRVLLIDSDIRKGKIHSSLAQRQSPGLAEILAAEIPDINDAINHIEDGFDFIAAGNYPSNPSELLMTDHLKLLLNDCSKNYDIIIIDTPPVLAVTDSIIIAKHTAVTLMVIGIGTDHMEEIELTIKRVKKNGIDIQGLVFNNKSQSPKTYGQYNYYYAYQSK